MEFDAQSRREILLIVKEAINNIVRHSGATHATIAMQPQAGRLIVTVSDNGRGFDPAARTRGLGLASLQQRARKLQGALTIDAAPGRGAAIQLEVPLGQQRWFSRWAR